ncbi:MAG: hypothetical protein WBF86_02355 [Mycobacterium sp.]
MSRLSLTLASTAAFLVLSAVIGSEQASAQGGIDTGAHTANEDLFYNFYAGPAGGIPAQMYISPKPTPRWVGHTYITYQPFMPHEFMYRHSRIYHRDHLRGGTTRTRIRYR